MTDTAEITLWEGPDVAQNREPRAQRPCSCGCDNRGREVPIIGYVSASRKGKGITIIATTEDMYQRLVDVFGGQRGRRRKAGIA